MSQLFKSDEYVKKILQGDRIMLSRAITLVESTLPEHQNLAIDVIQKCLAFSGNSIRIGVTGVPGVGKSTFIEAFGSYLIEKHNKKVAVLSIDPSSTQSKGSILGDKTRMPNLANNSMAYIRPSASSGSLGGVARKTRESILLCEAAGYDIVIVETVGVGQSETEVHSMVDFFLLLMLSGAGDELQGMKKGIMEMADTIAINKADGENIKASDIAAKEYKRALHLFPPKENDWVTEVITCSSIENTGLQKIWDIISAFEKQMKESNWWSKNRNEQNRFWLHDSIKQMLLYRFYNDSKNKKLIKQLEIDVIKGKISSFEAASRIIGK